MRASGCLRHPSVPLLLSLLLVAWLSPGLAARAQPARQATLFRARRSLKAASASDAAASASSSNASGGSTTVNITATAASSSVAAAPSNSSAPAQLFSWHQFAGPDEDAANLIIVFKRHRIADRFRPFCGKAWQQQQQQQVGTVTAETVVPRGSAEGSEASEICGSLRGACRHLFKHAFAGVSGRFTRQHFSALQHCAGVDGISYIERDGQVAKQEASSYTNWWLDRAPQGTSLEALLTLQRKQQQQQQQQQHGSAPSTNLIAPTVQSFDQVGPVPEGGGGQQQDSSLPVEQQPGSPAPVSSTAASSDSSASPVHLTDSTIHDNDMTHEQTLQDASNSSSSSSSENNPNGQQLWGWILAEVGLAAQKQLATGLPTVAATVAASNGPASEQVVKTAEGGGDAVVDAAQDAGSRVTKNQDPGLPVDAAAIANPEILAFMPAGENATGPQAKQTLPQQQVEAANRQPGIKVQRLVTALWNLDRLDQRNLPLDGNFSYGSETAAGTGKNVTIYMLDSGIKVDHQEFQPWGSSSKGTGRAKAGPDFVDDDGTGDDCDGHGTHVSSTAAGRSVGIAREATVVGVRVLDCDGAGSISNVVAALDWVVENAKQPAVASLSLGVPSGQWSKSLEDAVKKVVAEGIAVVVAAGNSAVDACGVAPARVPEAITVAASNLPSKFQGTSSADAENLYRWSNTGACIDVFAPGVDIYGACGGPSRCETVDDTAYTWASGTSMAAPHVTGMIAVYLEKHPSASPSEVHEALVNAATTGLLKSNLMLESTPNRMLYSRWDSTDGQPALPSVVATGGNQ